MSVHDRNKILLAPLPSALSEGGELAIHTALDEVFAPGSGISLGHPSGTMQGPDNLWKNVYAPLLVAMPDLERRDFIVMARPCLGDFRGGNWVGLGANFIGTLAWPWLGIQGAGKPAFMRYHESFRIEDTPDRRDRRTPGHPPTHAAGRRLAHGDTACIGAARLFTGERPAASGRQEEIRPGTFMGIKPAFRRIGIRDTAFRRINTGRISDNPLIVDLPHASVQLGQQMFNGENREAWDRGERVSHRTERHESK